MRSASRGWPATSSSCCPALSPHRTSASRNCRSSRPGERRDLLAARVQTRPFDSEEPLHRAFARQAASRPDEVALSCGADRLTYGGAGSPLESAGALPSLARRRAGRSRRPLPRALDRAWWSGFSASSRRAAHTCPFDPIYPADRRAFMIEDSGVRIVLTAGRARTGDRGDECGDARTGPLIGVARRVRAMVTSRSRASTPTSSPM